MGIRECGRFVSKFFKQRAKAHMMLFLIQIIDDRVSYEADGCRTYLGLKAVAGIFPQKKELLALLEEYFACPALGIFLDNCRSLKACICAYECDPFGFFFLFLSFGHRFFRFVVAFYKYDYDGLAGHCCLDFFQK